jgi:hypothetical protein
MKLKLRGFADHGNQATIVRIWSDYCTFAGLAAFGLADRVSLFALRVCGAAQVGGKVIRFKKRNASVVVSPLHRAFLDRAPTTRRPEFSST